MAQRSLRTLVLRFALRTGFKQGRSDGSEEHEKRGERLNRERRKFATAASAQWCSFPWRSGRGGEMARGLRLEGCVAEGARQGSRGRAQSWEGSAAPGPLRAAEARPAAPPAENAGTGGQRRVLRLEVITLRQIDRCGDQPRTAASAPLPRRQKPALGFCSRALRGLAPR